MAINWAPSPEIFSIGPIHIRYYSVLFVSGFIIGYYIFVKFFKREGLPVEILDMLLYTLLGSAVVGARLGHCLFYEPEYYLARPLEIFKVWEGGLASHGGAIAILIAIWYYVKKYGQKYGFDYMWLMDRIGVATPLAGALIRLGNLMNSEIYGNPTDLPWGFVFLLRGETVAKHPTQLYEALAYLVTFAVLMLLYFKALPKLKRGTLFGLFFIGIFGSRFFIEFVKEPQVAFEQGMTLNMGQWLSIPLVLMGVAIMVWGIYKKIPAEIVIKKKG
ncbi:MAG: prolipoprotein diacylglyceryl transferase [Bacteroidetes bacterium GWE2_39_28]|nr:MAG: prolipoprotein diacylglyceryl transferase [Bacteroidetes bacterium GWE2_39_28]OFY11891.1 MAG: prolipoprotein diacylglyceryl transferase [Bacteroidetes bacterium GWF2_39_10]OFZ08477.1 MAG: prolipoprotein diacylglyceryl transferase [Bacteroidetes bacterium RIFOXYB2_FULL_39_7]OFZ11387.1 MAG: prolipoprotein diacylglyceryl transferase [Bacteroidetes bacterium RIFOXYC2_FULL_39_11]HCT95198.1 prolipoprotein diacylglyceryl transferase [Rikenellaceae bacterium]